MPLKGLQLSVLVEVPPYPLENPPRQGDRILTHSGAATVTHLERIGKTDIIFADYGSGDAQPHLPESLLSPPEPPQQGQSQQQKQRRHSAKGKASGWIEERRGNKKRPTPSTYYVYKWEDITGRHSRYIPTRKVAQVQRLCEVEHRAISEILEVLCN